MSSKIKDHLMSIKEQVREQELQREEVVKMKDALRYVEAIESGDEDVTSVLEAAKLSLSDIEVKGGKLFVTINGSPYSYSANGTGDFKGKGIDEIAAHFKKIMKHNAGRALAWLKKNTTLESGSKKEMVDFTVDGIKLSEDEKTLFDKYFKVEDGKLSFEEFETVGKEIEALSDLEELKNLYKKVGKVAFEKEESEDDEGSDDSNDDSNDDEEPKVEESTEVKTVCPDCDYETEGKLTEVEKDCPLCYSHMEVTEETLKELKLESIGKDAKRIRDFINGYVELDEKVDKEQVMKIAKSIAKKAFGDKYDEKKIEAAVEGIVKKSKDTEEAIAIVQKSFGS
jgi:hypothetical protein